MTFRLLPQWYHQLSGVEHEGKYICMIPECLSDSLPPSTEMGDSRRRYDSTWWGALLQQVIPSVNILCVSVY